MEETRKLAAILAADVVGYSRLASADEDRTLARLRTLRSDLIDPTIAAVKKQLGDVIEQGEPTLGAEDFALMAELVPSFQLGIGSGQPGRKDRLHNSAYQPDERCIGLGVQAVARAALEILS